MKKLGIYLFVFFVGTQIWGQQRPYINSIDPKTGKFDETVTINGSGFPSIGNLKVYFGAGLAEVISSSANQIKVKVPATATLAPIMVINTSTGLSSSSSDFFTLSFGGSFNTNMSVSFSSVINRVTGQRLAYDLCLCDFDGDGLTDVATSARDASTSTTGKVVFRNITTSVDTILFSNPITFGLAIPSTNINCADLDGDGKPDLVVTQINHPSNQPLNVEYYRNTSTGTNITFAAAQTFIPKLDGNGNFRPAIRIELADLDGDGKIDLVLTNETDDFFDIHRNTSTVGSINFNTSPFQLRLPAGNQLKARGIKIADLNNDNLPDIAIAPFNDRPISIFENKSTANNFQFGSAVQTTGASQYTFRNITTADFNGDGFLDIVAVDGNISASQGRVVIFTNTTQNSSDTPSFASPVQITTIGNEPWGVDAGDVDGDGKPDFVVAIAEVGFNRIELYRNTFTGTGNVQFSTHLISTSFNSRNIKMGDLNNDSKPDIIFTSRSQNLQPANLSYFENLLCTTPALSPTNGVFCPNTAGGGSFVVTATPLPNATYSWEVSLNNGAFSVVTGNSTNKLDVAVYNADVRVRVTATQGSCNELSPTASFTRNTNTPQNPVINGTLNYCDGESVTLNSSITANTTYSWTGPDGFTQSGIANSITINNASSIKSGEYSLQIQVTGGCLSQKVNANVVVISPPAPNITNNGTDAFCAGGQTTLVVTNYPGFNYQWRQGVTNLGTTASQVANSSGNYTLTITDPGSGCSKTTAAYTITEVDAPISTITANDEICEDVAIDFSANTTNLTDPFTVEYNWTFLTSGGATDGQSTGTSTNYTFSAPDTYTARLVTTYNEVANCSTTLTKEILVSAPPTNIVISAPTLEKCPADSILLELPQNLTNYDWSTGDAGFSTYAKTEVNQDDVTVTVTAQTNIGCTIIDEITISNFANSGIFITSPTATIVDNILNIPAGIKNIQLVATNGSNYFWEPAAIFDNPTAANVTVFPKSVSTQITLNGDDANNCETSTELLLVNENVVGRNSFSPNGDGVGFECWEILNANTLNACEILIFDKRGRNILKLSTPFDSDCIWDGSTQGSPAPSGIYYYVLKCEDSDFNRSGNILLAR